MPSDVGRGPLDGGAERGAGPAAPSAPVAPAVLAPQPVVLYPAARGPLGSLAARTGRSFASGDEATAAILRTVAEQLGMRTSLLTRIEGEENRVLAAHNAPDGSGIRPGMVLPLAHTY